MAGRAAVLGAKDWYHSILTMTKMQRIPPTRRLAVRRQGHGTIAKSLSLHQARLTIWRLKTVTVTASALGKYSELTRLDSDL